MGWVIALVIIIAVVTLDVAMLHNAKPDETPVAPYVRSPYLFTPVERSLLGVLDQVVGDRARIFGKVRVADVVAPGSGVTGSGRNDPQHKLSRSRFDFLLCNRDDLSVICAIALDDGTRRLKGKLHPSAYLSEVCHAAGIPLIHVPARIASTLDEVRKLLAPHLVAYQTET